MDEAKTVRDTIYRLTGEYRPKAPHCDDLILHAPGKCVYCDEYAEEQQERIRDGVNFTGEGDPNKKTCPAEQRRALRDINRWGGNTPKGA